MSVALQRILQLVWLPSRSADSKELIVVLRHELAVLRRQIRRPAFRPADRWFLAAASRLFPRVRGSVLLAVGGPIAAWTWASPNGRPAAATWTRAQPIPLKRRDRLGGLLHEYERAA